MKTLTLCCFLVCAAFSSVIAQTNTTSSSDKYTAYNRSIEVLSEKNREVLRFNEAQGAGIAWINGIEFSEGSIEFDTKGRNVMQKSFIGIAFHGTDDKTYETVYFRPFNFQSQDTVRRRHAVQYAYEPY
jgi:hypothetical protein